MDKEQIGIPKLRFPGFTGAWEQRKLGEVLSYEQPGPYIVSSDNYDDKYNVPVLTAGKSFLLGFTNETEGIKEATKSDPVIIFDDFTTGSHYVDFPFKVKSSALKILSKRSERIDTKFIYEVLSGINYIPQSHERHWISQFSKFNVMIPSFQEQYRISCLFKQLDSLIALHQRKLEHLKQQKNGLLQKMFPKNGESVPEVRFPGFTAPWEQRKLGDFGKVAMNKRIFKNQTSDEGDVPFYKIGTFGGVADSYITKELFEEYKLKYPYPRKGDLLISASGSIGRVIEYSGKDEYFQDSNIVWLDHDNRLDNSFLKQFYNIIKWQGLEGSTIKRLYNKNILATKIDVPSISEQLRIGDFFQQFDSLIALQQRRIEHLELLKKGLLQQMFV
ncbi:restriction endonuclease subunit S [Ligilactobacillus agilis]|uniref:restriction endonuclease subunit S n=2 Tax=Ligilactobacillus agilis TaxID=1601 RepID=UPI000C7B37AA|nr:restriction endonuclease subunit S [Ligilactobacillus agilis]PLA82974.1 restriction endonuclease subunit S [Ligilactobacillus agilis]